MTFAAENLEKRKEYLTPEFYQALQDVQTAGDPFTLREDLPKAFRVGACRATDSGVQFDLLLFWKTDTRSEQQAIKVDVENRGGKWLVSEVTN